MMQNKIRSFYIYGGELYESDPGYRTLNISGSYYTLLFPYMVYIIREQFSIIKPRSSFKTLHVGMRTSPLNAENIMEETLLFPPLPNIYACWLLACSKPSIEKFWTTPFRNHAGWATDKLLLNSGLNSFANWASMSPKKLVSIFYNWPKTIPFNYDKTTGFMGNNKNMPTKLKISDCMAPILYEIVGHVNGGDDYE